MVLEENLPAVHGIEARDQVEEGGFARAIRPDQSMISPCSIRRLTSWIAVSPPKRLVTIEYPTDINSNHSK